MVFPEPPRLSSALSFSRVNGYAPSLCPAPGYCVQVCHILECFPFHVLTAWDTASLSPVVHIQTRAKKSVVYTSEGMLSTMAGKGL